MGHDHAHAPANYNKAFAVGVALNAIYIGVEVAFGLLADSLALLADAGHNLSDVLGLLLAWGGYYLSQYPPTERHTYGFRSSSILAALLNALILMAAVGAIAWEAIRRFGQPQEITGGTIMWVAGAGVVVNGITALLFMQGRRHDLNIRGAFLHMAADAGVSVGVVLAGLAILGTGIEWIDPAVSLLVAGVILLSTWSLLRDSVNLALHAVPKDIDPRAVANYLRGLPGVVDIHDLHIWPMSTTETALTAHLIKPEIDNEDALLARVCAELHERFGIEHATLQFERGRDANACRQAPPDVV